MSGQARGGSYTAVQGVVGVDGTRAGRLYLTVKLSEQREYNDDSLADFESIFKVEMLVSVLVVGCRDHLKNLHCS